MTDEQQHAPAPRDGASGAGFDSNKEQVQWSGAGQKPAPNIQLKSAREAAGLSISDICGKTRLTTKQVQAMENGDWSALPPGAYARAFVKSYAKILGLDAEAIANEALGSIGAVPAGFAPSPDLAQSRVAGAAGLGAAPNSLGTFGQSALEKSLGKTVTPSRNKPLDDFNSAGHSSDQRMVKGAVAVLVIALAAYIAGPTLLRQFEKPEATQVSEGMPPPAAVVPPDAIKEEPAPAEGAAPTESSNSAASAQQAGVSLPLSAAPTTAPVTPAAPTATANVASLPQTAPAPLPPAAAPASEPKKLSSAQAPSAQAAMPPGNPAPAAPAQPELKKPASPSAPAASAPAPVSAPQAAASPASSGKTYKLKFVFSDRAWVTVKDKEGNVITSALNQPGTERTIEGMGPFRVVVGNSTAVKVEFKGTKVDLGPFTKDDVARVVLE